MGGRNEGGLGAGVVEYMSALPSKRKSCQQMSKYIVPFSQTLSHYSADSLRPKPGSAIPSRFPVFGYISSYLP